MPLTRLAAAPLATLSPQAGRGKKRVIDDKGNDFFKELNLG